MSDLADALNQIASDNAANGISTNFFFVIANAAGGDATTTRTLTSGEDAIAKAEFPTGLDTSQLRIAYDMSGNSAYTPNNTIHFPSSVSGCTDFSSCYNGAYIGWFVHETTHAWQYQNGISPIWGHIFSLDILTFGDYLSREEYYNTPNPSNLSTEEQADWHMWHYLCTYGSSC